MEIKIGEHYLKAKAALEKDNKVVRIICEDFNGSKITTGDICDDRINLVIDSNGVVIASYTG